MIYHLHVHLLTFLRLLSMNPDLRIQWSCYTHEEWLRIPVHPVLSIVRLVRNPPNYASSDSDAASQSGPDDIGSDGSICTIE
jgi:hypothetical protein